MDELARADMSKIFREAWVEVDTGAIRDNAAALVAMCGQSEVCAVVKADGYGHGATRSARAALEGGATTLAVALVEEGCQLRDDGIDAPILLLSEPPLAAMAEVIANRLTPTLYTMEGVEAAEAAAVAVGDARLGVHLKVDTGMNRVGASTSDAPHIAVAISKTSSLRLDGMFTHFAVADEADDPFTKEQASRFLYVVTELQRRGVETPKLHCCNSAATLLYPELHMSMVRTGIALYGVAPSVDVALPSAFRPAMSVKARVSYVKTVGSGEALSYGHRYVVRSPSFVATVPIGYADGLPRNLASGGGEVLIGARRFPLAGTVTMDQFLIDCGEFRVARGDEVVIIGDQGEGRLRAEELAERIGTIGYEVVCRIGPRLPRRYI